MYSISVKKETFIAEWPDLVKFVIFLNLQPFIWIFYLFIFSEMKQKDFLTCEINEKQWSGQYF